MDKSRASNEELPSAEDPHNETFAPSQRDDIADAQDEYRQEARRGHSANTRAPKADNSPDSAVNEVLKEHYPIILDKKIPFKQDFLKGKNDKVLRDISNLLENFERVFVAYINENYRSFTE